MGTLTEQTKRDTFPWSVVAMPGWARASSGWFGSLGLEKGACMWAPRLLDLPLAGEDRHTGWKGLAEESTGPVWGWPAAGGTPFSWWDLRPAPQLCKEQRETQDRRAVEVLRKRGTGRGKMQNLATYLPIWLPLFPTLSLSHTWKYDWGLGSPGSWVRHERKPRCPSHSLLSSFLQMEEGMCVVLRMENREQGCYPLVKGHRDLGGRQPRGRSEGELGGPHRLNLHHFRGMASPGCPSKGLLDRCEDPGAWLRERSSMVTPRERDGLLTGVEVILVASAEARELSLIHI